MSDFHIIENSKLNHCKHHLLTGLLRTTRYSRLVDEQKIVIDISVGGGGLCLCFMSVLSKLDILRTE